eukprot:s4176_g4.t3
MAVQGLVEVRTLSESVQAYFLGQNGTSAAFQCTGSSCHIWGATHVDFASSVGCREPNTLKHPEVTSYCCKMHENVGNRENLHTAFKTDEGEEWRQRLCWAILGPRCAMIRILGPFEAADFAI